MCFIVYIFSVDWLVMLFVVLLLIVEKVLVSLFINVLDIWCRVVRKKESVGIFIFLVFLNICLYEKKEN